MTALLIVAAVLNALIAAFAARDGERFIALGFSIMAIMAISALLLRLA